MEDAGLEGLRYCEGGMGVFSPRGEKIEDKWVDISTWTHISLQKIRGDGPISAQIRDTKLKAL